MINRFKHLAFSQGASWRAVPGRHQVCAGSHTGRTPIAVPGYLFGVQVPSLWERLFFPGVAFKTQLHSGVLGLKPIGFLSSFPYTNIHTYHACAIYMSSSNMRM